MVVFQFGFDPSTRPTCTRPNHPTDAVVYSGTHDNDTVLGWYSGLDEAARAVVDGRSTPPACVPRVALVDDPARARFAARVAMVQMQDVLELGSEARMNTPGARREPGGGGWTAARDGFGAPLAG